MFIQTVRRHPPDEAPLDVSARIRLIAIQASLAARATTGTTPLVAAPIAAALRIRTGTPTTGDKAKAERAGGSNGGRIE